MQSFGKPPRPSFTSNKIINQNGKNNNEMQNPNN